MCMCMWVRSDRVLEEGEHGEVLSLVAAGVGDGRAHLEHAVHRHRAQQRRTRLHMWHVRVRVRVRVRVLQVRSLTGMITP